MYNLKSILQNEKEYTTTNEFLIFTPQKYSENDKHAYKYGNASNKGSKNGFSVLTEEQVLEIRKKRIENKMTYQKLAKMYNVSYGCIAGIIQRTNWKHI